MPPAYTTPRDLLSRGGPGQGRRPWTPGAPQPESSKFAVLIKVARHPGQVLSCDAIWEDLRGTDAGPVERQVALIISRLRQKLRDDPKHPRFLKTVWGTGYLFVAAPNA